MLFVLLIMCVVPFMTMMMMALDKNANISLRPITEIPFSDLGFSNFKFIFAHYNFLNYFWNTILVTVVSIAITLASALVSGYAYSMLDFPFKRFIFMFGITAMMIPSALTLIPSYLLAKYLGLYDSYYALWLPLFGSVYFFFFAKQYFDSLPGELRLAAQVDGMGEMRIFSYIYLPMCGPILATLGILLFIAIYNDLLGPLIFLRTESKYTLTVKMAFLTAGRNSAAYGVNLAMSVLIVLPVMAIFSFFQKYIIESIAVTGIKE